MDIEWHIGDVIAKLRKQRRLNQTTFAHRVGVNKATIVRAEDGDPKVSRAIYLRIATALGIDLATLEVEAARLSPSSPTASAPPIAGSSARRPPTIPSASVSDHHGETGAVSDRASAEERRLRDQVKRTLLEADALDRSARAAGTPRQHAAAPDARASRRRADARKHRR